MTNENRRSGPPDNPGSPRSVYDLRLWLQRQPHPVRQISLPAVRSTGAGPSRRHAQLCQTLRRGFAMGPRICLARLQRGDRILMFLDDTPAYPGRSSARSAPGFVPC